MSKHIYLHLRRHVNPLAKKAADANALVVWVEMRDGSTRKVELTREQMIALNAKGGDKTAVVRTMALALGAKAIRATSNGATVAEWESPPAAHDGGEWGIRWSEAKGMGAATPKEKFFPTQAQRDQYAAQLEKKDGFVEFLAWSNPPGTPAGDASAEYLAALAKSNEASRAYSKVQEAYRAGRLTDQEYLAARKVHEAAMREFDVAFAKEQARSGRDAALAIDADTWLFKTNSWELESWTNKTPSWALQRAKELTTVGNRVVDIYHNGQFYKQVLPSNQLLPHQEQERRKDRGVGG